MLAPTSYRRSITSTTMFALLSLTACGRMRFPEIASDYREYAYVANSGAGTVSVIDLVNLRSERTLRVGDDPERVAVNPARNEIYAVNTASGTVTVIDAETNAVTRTIGVHRQPHSIAVDSKGNFAYVTNSGANTVSVIDLKAQRETATASTGEMPDTVRIAADGRALVVSNRQSGSASIYAIENMGLLRLRFTVDKCAGASDVAILSDSSKAFIACTDGDAVLAISLASAPGSWAAKQDSAAQQDHFLARLQVGKKPAHLALKPDSGELFVTNAGSNSVSEISTFTNEVGGTYMIGTTPSHGLVSDDNSTLWISNAGADSVSLYSIDDGRMTLSVHTGPQPQAMALSLKQPLLLVADAKSGDVAVIRTRDTNGPNLFTMLPAGTHPVDIAIKGYTAR